jgi:hypothetical protein
MTARIATGAWLAYAAAAGLMALFALVKWGQALALAGPVLYGEGAVAHAAILARTFATYGDAAGATFTAANYPPLYFLIASVGDPFVTGRLLSAIATIGIAGLIVWRAWPGGGVTAIALGLGWLALSPVAVWGPAVKPDLVALALTVVAVLAFERRRAGLAAVLLVAAAATKPTALLPALALVLWTAWRDRALLRPFVVAAGVAAAVAVGAAIPFGYAGLWRHVVVLNALPWSAESALLLAFLAVFLLGALVGAALVLRGFGGPIAAYAVAAVCIVALGGREGATINYLLDLAAAGSLGLASAAGRLSRTPLYPALAIASLAVAAVLLDPLGIVPGRAATTGAWADPARVATVRAALASDEPVLAEDSGLLIATGHRVVVDDLFLWSRSVANGTIDPAALLADVGAARFTAIVSEADLSQLAAGPAYERSRWEPSLVRTILDRYRIDSRSADGLVFYRPR